MFSGHLTSKKSLPIALFGLVNFLAIFLVNRVSDLPVLMNYWDRKTLSMVHFHFPSDNYYPPGASMLLLPFVWARPNYEIAVYFYFVLSSIIYFQICQKVIINSKLKIVALIAFTFNPYLLWLCNSGQDTVFELFLLLSFAALLLRGSRIAMYLPLYFLCLVRPAYWTTLFTLPIVIFLYQRRKRSHVQAKSLVIPFFALLMTLTLNIIAFGSPNLASSSGGTAFFSHNKYYYLSMPKFDMDVFLSKGGNMIPNRVLQGSSLFKNIGDPDLRAALVSIVNNPKSVVLNSMQKVDSYFFTTQKTPQLPGSYFLSEDQKSIIIENERLSWFLILGNATYFFYRSMLLVLGIMAITIYFIEFRRKRFVFPQGVGFFWVPYLSGAIPGILYYTETRFKVVSEMLLVPLILAIFDKLFAMREKEIE